jgi:3-deoxy-D-manno-octulosonate 8-phosphate phosphatase (KDO 8-P phosphatase)
MIKLVILDVDGVMTDGTKYYDRDGKVVLKLFCDKDWTTIKRFRAIGIPVVFITGDPYNEMILKNRNLPVVVNRGDGFHRDKVNFLDEVLNEYGCERENVVYLGDDLFDYGIMSKVGYPYCVSNSPRTLKQISDVLQCNGGENAVMYLFEDLEDKNLIPIVSYDEVMEKIYDLDLKEKF